MLRKYSLAILIVSVLVLAFAWSPWLTQSAAEAQAVAWFNHSWQVVTDGCGTNCRGCGAVSSQRVPFGVRVTLEFACGLLPEDSPEYHQKATGFVSAFGTVHGLPRP